MFRIAAFCICLTAALPLPVALADDRNDCSYHSDFEVRIAACGRLLQRGVKPSKDRAEVLGNRAQGYGDKAEWDLAIADLDEAIRLDSSTHYSISWRAKFNFNKGNIERGHADFAQCVQVSRDCLSNRAYALETLASTTRRSRT
jgi:hypothetical protein